MLDRFQEKFILNVPSTHHTGPRFKLGRILATPGALEVIADARISIVDLLIKHLRGDFGEIAESDRAENELAIATGKRILSSYVLVNRQTIWLVTEADRSATTFLLPGDY